MRSNKIRIDTVTNVFASKVADVFFSFSPLERTFHRLRVLKLSIAGVHCRLSELYELLAGTCGLR